MFEDQFSMAGEMPLLRGKKKEPCKRKSRNMSEKKRRDEFNNLVTELCAMVSKNKKMDKTTVLKTAIAVIKSQKERADEMRSHEIKELWKPSFMSNDEFEHLMLDAVNAFLILFDKNGRIIHVSESVAPLLGHSCEDLIGSSLFDLLHPGDRPKIVSQITKHKASSTVFTSETPKEDYYITFDCNLECESVEPSGTPVYERVHFEGIISFLKTESCEDLNEESQELCFCCVVKLCNLQLIREQSATKGEKKEFTARHSLEWKFLFLDHRGPPIIGYLPLEVLGTSGYDYIHPDDMQDLAKSHEALMQSGEGQSCYYRFLTKGQQWIWLRTRYYITYHQWNSKPEFVVCTNTVVTYAEVQKYMQQEGKGPSAVKKKIISRKRREDHMGNDETQQVTTSSSEMPDADTDLNTVEVKTESQIHREPSGGKIVVANQAHPLLHEIDPGCAPSQQLISLQQSSSLQQQDQQGDVSTVSTPNTIEALNRIILSSHPLVMTTLQQQLHLKLLEKQQKLQETILNQQRELLKIHNQLSLSTELGSTLLLVQQPKPHGDANQASAVQNMSNLVSLSTQNPSGLLQNTAGALQGSAYENIATIPPQLEPHLGESSATSTTKLLHHLQQQHQQQQVSPDPSSSHLHPAVSGVHHHDLPQVPTQFPAQISALATHQSSFQGQQIPPISQSTSQHPHQQLSLVTSPQGSTQHLQYVTTSHAPRQTHTSAHPHQSVVQVSMDKPSHQFNSALQKMPPTMHFERTTNPRHHLPSSSSIKLSDHHPHHHQLPPHPHQQNPLSSQSQTPIYTVSQMRKSPFESTTPSPAPIIAQLSPSPVGLMLSHDPMINSGGQTFEPLAFSVSAQQE